MDWWLEKIKYICCLRLPSPDGKEAETSFYATEKCGCFDPAALFIVPVYADVTIRFKYEDNFTFEGEPIFDKRKVVEKCILRVPLYIRNLMLETVAPSGTARIIGVDKLAPHERLAVMVALYRYYREYIRYAEICRGRFAYVEWRRGRELTKTGSRLFFECTEDFKADTWVHHYQIGCYIKDALSNKRLLEKLKAMLEELDTPEDVIRNNNLAELEIE